MREGEQAEYKKQEPGRQTRLQADWWVCQLEKQGRGQFLNINIKENVLSCLVSTAVYWPTYITE